MVLSSSLSSCSLFESKEPEAGKKEKKPETKLVGRIASISADKKFVMIQSYGTWNVAAGSILTTQGPDQRVSNLRCSGEKLGQFAAADIQAGLPMMGDAVFYNPPETAANGPKPPEGFTPSLNSGAAGQPQLPQPP